MEGISGPGLPWAPRIGVEGTDLVTGPLQSDDQPLVAGQEGESTLKTRRSRHGAAVGKALKIGVGREWEASPLRVGMWEWNSSKRFRSQEDEVYWRGKGLMTVRSTSMACVRPSAP